MTIHLPKSRNVILKGDLPEVRTSQSCKQINHYFLLTIYIRTLCDQFYLITYPCSFAHTYVCVYKLYNVLFVDKQKSMKNGRGNLMLLRSLKYNPSIIIYTYVYTYCIYVYSPIYGNSKMEPI